MEKLKSRIARINGADAEIMNDFVLFVIRKALPTTTLLVKLPAHFHLY